MLVRCFHAQIVPVISAYLIGIAAGEEKVRYRCSLLGPKLVLPRLLSVQALAKFNYRGPCAVQLLGRGEQSI